MVRIQWPYKSESHCLPLGSNLSNYFHSILTRRPHQLLKVNTKRTELTHLSAKTPLFSHRYTLCLRHYWEFHFFQQIVSIWLVQPSCHSQAPAYWLWYVFHKNSFSSLSLESKWQHTILLAVTDTVFLQQPPQVLFSQKKSSQLCSLFIMVHAKSTTSPLQSPNNSPRIFFISPEMSSFPEFCFPCFLPVCVPLGHA